MFYCSLPSVDFPDEQFGLGNIPLVVLSQALEILQILEIVDWKWDINTILAQPAELLQAVLQMKVIGEKLRKEHSDDVE